MALNMVELVPITSLLLADPSHYILGRRAAGNTSAFVVVSAVLVGLQSTQSQREKPV